MSVTAAVVISVIIFFFNDTATTEIYTLSLHDALPISPSEIDGETVVYGGDLTASGAPDALVQTARSEEHTSELQSRLHLVCRLLLEKKKAPGDLSGELPITEAELEPNGDLDSAENDGE